MKLKFLSLLFLACLGSFQLYSQCPTPSVLAVSNTYYGRVVHYTSGIDGTYYIEYGNPGFIPGTGASAGSGGTVVTGGSNGMKTINFPPNFTTLDIYVRVLCSGNIWSSNSAPFVLSSSLPYSPLFVTQLVELGVVVNNAFNDPGLPSSMQNTCSFGIPTGSEWRFRFDSPDDGFFELKQIASSSLPHTLIGIKTLNNTATPSSYTCLNPLSSSNINPYINYYYKLGPLNKGTAYELIFDAQDTVYTTESFVISCPAPSSITKSNITPSSIDIGWNCTTCNDSILLEFGPTGFVPGTAQAAGTGGTVVIANSSPGTLTGLTPFTEYDLYVRSTCGGYYSANKKYKFKTAKDCSTFPSLSCGNSGQFHYAGNVAVRGAWDLGGTDSSEEAVYIFTPTVTNSYDIHIYQLSSNWTGYNFPLRVYIKELSAGCNEAGWTTIGNTSQNPLSFSPVTFSTGTLNAGTSYMIAFDASTYTSYRSYRYYFQLLCLNTCIGPQVSTIANVSPTSATINAVCNTCFTNGILEYGPSGFTPGTGINPGAGGTLINPVTFPYIISGLASATSYDVYVRSDCSSSGLGFSTNDGPHTFYTCSSAPTGITTSTGTSNTSCYGDSITLYRNGGQLAPGSTFVWYSGSCGGTPVGTGDSVTVSPLVATTYFVRAEGPCGNSVCAVRTITPTYQQLSINGNDTICQGQTTTLSASSAWPTYSWSTSATTSSVNVGFPGYITLTVTAPGGCTDTASIVVVMLPLPAVGIVGDNDICSGQSTVLDAGGPYASYIWSTGATTQTISVSTAGNYTVTVTGTNGCTGTDTFSVTVHPSPTPTITGNTTICSGSFTVLNAGAAYSSYNWFTGATTQTISVTSPGTYTVIVTDMYGCTGTDDITIVVNPNPIPAITGDSTLCFGETTTLNAGGGFLSYFWSTGSVTQTINISSSGPYTVTVTDANGCNGTDGIFVVMFPQVSVAINASGPTTFCQGDSVILTASPGLAAWQWRRGNYLLPGATNNTITVRRSGNYSCIGYDLTGCFDTSGVVQVSVPCVPIDPPGNKDDFNTEDEMLIASVFPNPTTGELFLNTNCQHPDLISVSDAQGRSVPFSLSENGNGDFRITGLPNGIYVLNLSCNQQLYRTRIIKFDQ